MDRAELMRQVRAGQYVVDPHAVAGAMLRRPGVREALLGSERHEAVERGHREGATGEARPRPHPGAA